jgi:AcrR family transcriptional regulator
MTRDKILQAARELFEEKGFDFASVRDIAAKADVNVALINYHFGSKESLLAALIEDMATLMHVKLSDISNSNAGPEEKLFQTVELVLERIFENKKYYQMIHRELSTVQRPALNQKISKTLRRNRDVIKKIIEEGQQKKVFRKDIDTELTIGTMFGLIYQATNAGLKLNITPSDDESIKIRVKKHLWDMLTCFLLKK